MAGLGDSPHDVDSHHFAVVLLIVFAIKACPAYLDVHIIQ